MSPACILCHLPARHRLASHGHAIHRCAPCDIEFVWPRPDARVLSDVYAQGYFTGDGPGYRDYLGREREISVSKARLRLDALAALGCSVGHMLDIGCAAGIFLGEAHARGFDVGGVEPSPEARSALPKHLRDTVVPSLDAVDRAYPYDVVTLWDVLEHLPDPVTTLRSVRGLTHSGSLVAVVVPCIGNVNTRWAPRTWDQYKAPEHLTFFSPRSLRTLLTREIGPVVHEHTAWQREGRWYDPEGLHTHPFAGSLRSIDRAVGRALAVLLGPDALVDSVAVYARVP